MQIDNYIRCCFDGHGIEDIDQAPVNIETYFAETNDIISVYQKLTVYINNNDLMRAEKFHFENDRNTYLMCHTLLRSVLSVKLKKRHSEIVIESDRNNKPGLRGNQLYFNISHTREAFAFAISEHERVGIDIEKADREIDFRSIIKTFFSSGEVKYILEDPGKSQERFVLLWTRKEALIKALGTGMIDKLEEVEVFRNVNFLNHKSFNNIIDNSLFCDHYIYSEIIRNYYFSVAVPSRSKIVLHHLDIQTIETLIDELESGCEFENYSG